MSFHRNRTIPDGVSYSFSVPITSGEGLSSSNSNSNSRLAGDTDISSSSTGISSVVLAAALISRINNNESATSTSTTSYSNNPPPYIYPGYFADQQRIRIEEEEKRKAAVLEAERVRIEAERLRIEAALKKQADEDEAERLRLEAEIKKKKADEDEAEEVARLARIESDRLAAAQVEREKQLAKEQGKREAERRERLVKSDLDHIAVMVAERLRVEAAERKQEEDGGKGEKADPSAAAAPDVADVAEVVAVDEGDLERRRPSSPVLSNLNFINKYKTYIRRGSESRLGEGSLAADSIEAGAINESSALSNIIASLKFILSEEVRLVHKNNTIVKTDSFGLLSIELPPSSVVLDLVSKLNSFKIELSLCDSTKKLCSSPIIAVNTFGASKEESEPNCFLIKGIITDKCIEDLKSRVAVSTPQLQPQLQPQSQPPLSVSVSEGGGGRDVSNVSTTTALSILPASEKEVNIPLIKYAITIPAQPPHISVKIARAKCTFAPNAINLSVDVNVSITFNASVDIELHAIECNASMIELITILRNFHKNSQKQDFVFTFPSSAGAQALFSSSTNIISWKMTDRSVFLNSDNSSNAAVAAAGGSTRVVHLSASLAISKEEKDFIAQEIAAKHTALKTQQAANSTNTSNTTPPSVKWAAPVQLKLSSVDKRVPMSESELSASIRPIVEETDGGNKSSGTSGSGSGGSKEKTSSIMATINYTSKVEYQFSNPSWALEHS